VRTGGASRDFGDCPLIVNPEYVGDRIQQYTVIGARRSCHSVTVTVRPWKGSRLTQQALAHTSETCASGRFRTAAKPVD
jgi:hypothetical protein